MFKYVTIGLLWLVSTLVCAATPQNSVVIYDAEKDLLSIQAKQASLKAVLGQITLRTGVETLMSPGAEQRVDADIGPLAMERALKQLLKGIDHVVIYGGASQQGSPLVTRLEVLPKGEDAERGLMPVINIMNEASLQAVYRPTPEIFNIAQQRWQERVARLPEEKRLQVTARYDEKMAAAKQRQKRKDKRKAEHERRKQAHQLKKQKRDEALKASDPEFYEQRMQRREEIRAARGNSLE